MSFVSAQKARVLIGDFNFTPVTAQAGSEWPTDMLDVTTLNDTAKAFIPGLDTSTFTLSGWLDVDATADAHFDQMNDFKAAAAEPLTYAPGGLSLGTGLQMAGVLESQFGTGSQVADKVTFALGCQTSGPTEFGVSLHDLTAETIDGDGTGVDLTTASTTSGAVAHLHVTAFSGLTSAVVTIADSANNSTFATIGTFATATGLTSERLVITGTIRRYVRYSLDVTGTGSVTFAVSFARR
jgi:hypothetical protein